MPAPRVSDLIPFVHVASVERSVAFYELLGFTVEDRREHEGQVDWVALRSASARLMLAAASAPIDRHQQAVLFYLYADDLRALRDRLVTEGVAAGEIVDGSPGPSEEMGVSDPDGYCLMVAQTEAP